MTGSKACLTSSCNTRLCLRVPPGSLQHQPVQLLLQLCERGELNAPCLGRQFAVHLVGRTQGVRGGEGGGGDNYSTYVCFQSPQNERFHDLSCLADLLLVVGTGFIPLRWGGGGGEGGRGEEGERGGEGRGGREGGRDRYTHTHRRSIDNSIQHTQVRKVYNIIIYTVVKTDPSS